VVAITGTALINHTLDGLPSVALRQGMVSLSTLATVRSITARRSSRRTRIDEAAALRTIAQGAMFQQVEGAVVDVNPP
jgi:hypothetical protein